MMAESKIDVRFPDCDSMRIVHHAVYPIWYEMGRMDFFKACGFDYAYGRAREVDPAMINLEMSYGLPVRYPGEIRLQTRCVLCEGKKISFAYEVFYEENEKPIATAKGFHIWVQNGKGVNLEKAYPEMFGAYKNAIDG